MLAQQINITAQNAKTELDDDLAAEYASEFENESPEAITFAFRSWRRESPYMPTISDIATRIHDWHRERAAKEADRIMAEEAARTKEARECGALMTWPEVLQRFAEIDADKGTQTVQQTVEAIAKPMPRTSLEIETWDQQQLRQRQESLKADLGAWKDRRVK